VPYNGLSAPVTELAPDGLVTVLPLQLWRENEEDNDLLAWEREHHARPSKNLDITERSVCPGCKTSFTEGNTYCSVHRCRATTSKGTPCTKAARAEYGLMYCGSHGCTEKLLEGPDGVYVRCPERAERTLSQRCADHRQPRVPAVT
jgi:hypothetical protein